MSTWSLYQAGVYSNYSYNLSSVLYKAGANGSSSSGDLVSQTWTGNGSGTVTSQETTTSDGYTGTVDTTDASAFSYTQTATASTSAAASWTTSDYDAGNWANGSYAYTSATHNETSGDSTSYLGLGTYTQTSSGTWAHDAEGISTSGVNGTFAYSGSTSWSYEEESNATDSYSQHEEGKYANNSWAVTSGVLNTSGTVTYDADGEGGTTATNTTGFTSSSSYTWDSGSSDTASLHEEGTYSNGSWNLSCYLQQETALSSANETRTGESAATGQSSEFTYTWQAAETYTLYKAGTYSNASYNFSSFVLDDKYNTSDDYTETGNNANFSSYTREDTSSYTWHMHQTGTGSTASYTETSTSTYTHFFEGDETGGGTLEDSNSVAPGYTNSGSYDMADGEEHEGYAPPENDEEGGEQDSPASGATPSGETFEDRVLKPYGFTSFSMYQRWYELAFAALTNAELELAQVARKVLAASDLSDEDKQVMLAKLKDMYEGIAWLQFFMWDDELVEDGGWTPRDVMAALRSARSLIQDTYGVLYPRPQLTPTQENAALAPEVESSPGPRSDDIEARLRKLYQEYNQYRDKFKNIGDTLTDGMQELVAAGASWVDPTGAVHLGNAFLYGARGKYKEAENESWNALIDSVLFLVTLGVGKGLGAAVRAGDKIAIEVAVEEAGQTVTKTLEVTVTEEMLSKDGQAAAQAWKKELGQGLKLSDEELEAKVKDVVIPKRIPKKGGTYKEVRASNEGGEVHHMPADAASTIARDDGPAIWMETADHRMTASWGRSKAAEAYRARQAALIKDGKLREAIQMDIDDIRAKFGSKYDEAIKEMLARFGFTE